MITRNQNKIIESSNGRISRLVADNYDDIGRLRSQVIVTQIDKKETITWCTLVVPKWVVYVAVIAFTLIFIFLIATLAILYGTPRPSFYNETCDRRSCLGGLNLTCINKTCLCRSSQFYSNKCEDKRGYLGFCSFVFQCIDNKDFVCRDGVCKCNGTSYYSTNESACKLRKSYLQQCSFNDECRQDLLLTCDTTSNKCVCPSTTRYWDGTVCMAKRTINETCTSTNDCINSQSLKCINGYCNCNASIEYWETKDTKCYRKAYENETCISTSQCYLPMTCNSSTCRCPTYYYHSISTLTCKPQTLNNTSCSTTFSCRSDLGLECRNNLCQCVSQTPFWSAFHVKCIKQMTYGETTCAHLTDCLPSSSLRCNLDSGYVTCSCPTASTMGMCDCTRVVSNENYWNGSKCISANSYGMPCENATTSYMCKTLTEKTVCNSSTGTFLCECPIYNYFNGLACTNQLLNNTPCSMPTACRSDLGLTCQSSLCQCNTSYQFWSTLTSPNRCVDYLNYTQSCSANSLCHPYLGLICNSGTNNCSCPTAPSSNTCDCSRVSNNEYYWNGTTCVSALIEGSSCTADYMCQTVTQGTFCNSSSGVFICQCPALKYFNGSYCVDQVTNNVACPLGIECRTDYGLICQSGTCLCNATYQFWSTGVTPNICINYKNYTDACTANGDCNYWIGLICKTATNTACNCPSTSSNSKCDCTRELNNETYWNGTECVSALAIGSTCSSSSTNYMCKTLTQGTICNSSSGIFKCECPPLKYFNGSYCVDQVLNNVACPLGTECRSDYGLICQSGVCLCNTSYQFWSTTSTPIRCINYRNYTESCAANSDCNTKLGLICKSSTNSACNCPTTSVNNFCDCPREVNNETFWSGSACVAAGSYNSTCTVDYECETLTQNTTCLSGRCLCGTDGGIKTSTNKCAYCLTGWTYMFDTCYSASSTTTSNADSANIGTKTDTGCGKTGAAKAKITNSSVLSLFKTMQTSPREYWVDFWKGATGYFSTDGLASVDSTLWCSGYPDGSNAVYWSSGTNCYKSSSNNGGISIYYFCQYTPP